MMIKVLGVVSVIAMIGGAVLYWSFELWPGGILVFAGAIGAMYASRRL